MLPTTRDWLGAAVLTIVLVALTLLVIAAGAGAAKPA